MVIVPFTWLVQYLLSKSILKIAKKKKYTAYTRASKKKKKAKMPMI